MDGVVNAISGIFRIYASGKTFVATYKQGKKSWESGEGWGKTFLLIGASIFAIVNLGQMAAEGSEMMAADQAKNAASAAGEGAGEVTKNVESHGVKRGKLMDIESNIDLVSQSNGMLDSSGNINSVRIAELAKENKIPGFNFNDYLIDRNPGDVIRVDPADIFEKLAKNPTYGKYFNLDNMSSIESREAKNVLEQFLNKAGKLWIKVK